MLAAAPASKPYTWRGKDVKLLAEDPVVIMVEDFVSSSEAKHIIQLAEPEMKPSWVKNEYTGEHYLNPARTSHTYFVPVLAFF